MNQRTPTTLYRLYDADGVVLYIGIAGNPGKRFEQHAKDKAWWSQVSTIRLDHYAGRALALAAETAAIRSERPRHNIVGLPTGPVAVESNDGPWMVGGWSFSPRDGGAVRSGVHLELGWEAVGSDAVADIDDPDEAFRGWVGYLQRMGLVSARGWVPIGWTVASSDSHAISAPAPFQTSSAVCCSLDGEDFLTRFTWPVDAAGQHLNFLRLPMEPGRSAFITEVTGFAPGPLQPALHLPTLVEMAERES